MSNKLRKTCELVLVNGIEGIWGKAKTHREEQASW